MCDACAPDTPPQAQGSRRRRLWDLPHACHCPVVGVCFPLTTLRHLVNKALQGKAVADDYEIHVGAVAECTRRTRLSERLHKDLDARYAPVLMAFKAAKDTPALAAMWAQAVRQGDVAGAFWATLTHPRCDDVLQELALRDMHMLQHQAGAAIRVDMSRFQALLKENGVLTRELAKAQARCTQVVQEKSTELERLQAQLMTQRALVMGKDARIAFLSEDLAALRQQAPDLARAERLQAKLQQMRARLHDLEQQLQRVRTLRAVPERDVASPSAPAPEPTLAPTPPTETPIALHLGAKTVLCVGGRVGNVAQYREVIEQAGARFAHHDGGLEDHQGALDAVLAAADLVICQTGCISHNAYWRVKDFCKRTGKRCVFVENPSTSSLTRSLRAVVKAEAETG